MEILTTWGIPSVLFGLLGWLFKRRIDKRDAKVDEREKNIENLMFIIVQTSTATNVLAEATARAVQRIPDAHCNGDMTAALEKVKKIHEKEERFMMEQGIKHIFET